MSRPPVTIVVAPRERFSCTRSTLEHLYASTPPPFDLVCVDGGAPARIRAHLRSQSRAKGFHLLGGDAPLSPIRARNLGFEGVATPYVVFLDNDVVVAPGWLDALLDCAEATGAWIVAPLYCVDRPFHTRIHMAGGVAHFEERDGVRRFIESHTHLHTPLAAMRGSLTRGPCEQGEFHCLLVRTDAMRRLGPLDERFLAATEVQTDLCLRARSLGGGVWFEPSAVVTYDRPQSLRAMDLPYFLDRWSEGACAKGLEFFARRWSIAPDDPYLAMQREFAAWHLSVAYRPWLGVFRALSRRTRRKAAAWVATRVAAAVSAFSGIGGPWASTDLASQAGDGAAAPGRPAAPTR